MPEDTLLTGVSGEPLRRNKVPILLTVLLILQIAIFMIHQLQAQGHVWADVICRSGFGLCDQTFLLGAAVTLIFVASFVAVRRPDRKAG
jgi:hypothetical protein